MIKKPDIVCIGSVLWDIIGRSTAKMNLAADRPGKIIRIPGGVALNLAMSLQKNGFNSLILSVIGRDHEGDQLIEQLKLRRIITDYIDKNCHTLKEDDIFYIFRIKCLK